MRYIFFCCLFFLLISCHKTPEKGNYKAVFDGNYIENNKVVNYTTTYYFKITKSDKKEIWLTETSTQTQSILKKGANNSISGAIGFGQIYNVIPTGKTAFNILYVNGKYEKDNTMKGGFHTTLRSGDSLLEPQGLFSFSPH